MDSRLRGNDGGDLRRRESMVAVLVLRNNTASFPRRRESMVAILVLHDNTASFPRRRESMVAILVLHKNTASFPRKLESMVAVLVLHDNTASFPRRRESIKYDTSFVGWAKRSVPNALEASIPDVCQATCPNCQAANSESPHPVFQVAGHVCVERSLGFVGHDVDRRLFHDGCTVMDSRLRGNDGGDLRRRESMAAVLVLRDNTASFPRRRESMVAVLVLRDNTASFPRRRESMVAVLVLHDNTASFPRRRESIEYDSSSDVGWAKRSVPNALEVSIPKVCQATCPNCQAAKSDVPTPAFSGYWSRLCRAFPWLCLP